MKGFFISGTDTGIGKTIVSAAFMYHAAKKYEHVSYHKPIQTGADDDAKTVAQLLGDETNITVSTGLRLQKPLSPHMAARYQSTYIDFSLLVRKAKKQCDNAFTIVEGAGGLLVPINDDHLMIDLISALDLSCVLVARSSLGTINHTLLSIEALQKKNISLLGVVMVGEKNSDNEQSIIQYGGVKKILHIPLLPEVNKNFLTNMVNENKNAFDNFL